MSGIAGIIRFDGAPADPERVERMASAMADRGPDGITRWESGSVAFRHFMLRTTPESLEETQPLANEDESVVLVMDGRVDNCEDLRRRLAEHGARVRSRSDAELVLRAYELWGEDCLGRIDGDFAFVIWDDRRKTAFCARDAIGAKPFFYHWDGKRLIFASRVRAVTEAMDSAPALNEGVLAETLAFRWLTREETLWQGVSRLSAARFMWVDAAGLRVGTHWRPEDLPLIRYRTDREYVEHYLEVLREAVRRHCRALGPVGFEVSGGLDSSALYSVAVGLEGAGHLPAEAVRGFSLQFEPGTAAYELDYAHAVGAHVGRPITEVPPSVKPVDRIIAESVRLGWVDILPTGFMHSGEYRGVREAGGNVLINGVGGDQWLSSAQNDRAEALQLGHWRELGHSLREDMRTFGTSRSAYLMVRHGLYPLLPGGVRALARRMLRSERDVGDVAWWLAPRLRNILDERSREAARSRAERASGLRIGLRERIMTLESPYTVLATEMMGQTALAAGIENRSPMLSRPYVEMCLRFPMTQFRRGRLDKHVHRRAMEGLLPEKVRLRTSKADFSAVAGLYIEELATMDYPGDPPVKDWLIPEAITRMTSDMLRAEEADFCQHVDSLLCIACCNAIADHYKV